MKDEYNSGTAYRAMLKLFREAKEEMKKEVWVWKDTSESEKIRVDCPMCTVQRPPQELRDLGII